jgi:porphobilinogen synthase
MNFPNNRLRRLRTDKWLRDLIDNVILNSSDLVLPLFVIDASHKQEEIPSLPEIYRYSPDLILKQIESALKANIKAVSLFPVVANNLKTRDAREALNKNNLMCRTIKLIKHEFNNEIGVIADVALDPYNSDGHDGLVVNGKIVNDVTIEILAHQALIFAEAGCDIIAPSDMMDGRIGKIRGILELNKFHDVKILSYAAKFASNYYGPFRDAVNSKDALQGANKDSYQLSYKNDKEYMHEVLLDINEGADMIMIKPAMNYLDVINTVKDNVTIPIFAYQVSAEYAMLKLAEKNGVADYLSLQKESLFACKRAGCDAVFCYDAINVARSLES